MVLTHNKDALEPSSVLDDGPALKTYASLGDVLRGAREEHGQDLRTVAEVLRIRFAYLEAIEAGEFDRLPGTAYAVGFLRTYGEFLGFDGEEIIERFKEETQGAARKTELVFPEPVTETKIPGGAIILVSVLLLGAAYGGWIYLSNDGTNVADLISPLPQRLQAMVAGESKGASESAFADEAAGSEQSPSFTTPETNGSTPTAFTGPVETQDAPAASASDPRVSTDDTVAQDAPARDAPAQAASAQAASAQDAPARDAPAREAPAQAAPARAASAQAAPAQAAPAQDTSARDDPATQATAVVPEAPVTANRPSSTPAAARPEKALSEPAPAAPVVSVTEAPRTAGFDEPAPGPQTAAVPPSASNELPNAGPSPSRAILPPLEETIVIPAPPSVPQAMALSSDRSPRIYGVSTDDTRIVLRARQDSWVQIRDRQDALLLTRVLRAGDTYFVPVQEGLTLLTGNAGGIDIEVDGVAVQPLGPVGAVRRQIVLDPSRLLNGTAALH